MLFNRKYKREIEQKNAEIVKLEKALQDCHVEMDRFENQINYYNMQFAYIRGILDEVNPNIRLNAIKEIRDIVEAKK